MDSSARQHRAREGVGRRAVASSYLLELVPDVQSTESRRHRSYHSDSLFQLPSRHEDHGKHRGARHQELHSLAQHGWPGVRLEDRLPVATATKRHFSQATKRRSLSSDQSVAAVPEPTNPQDKIIFAESPLHPGVPIIYRPPEEKSANPDRLNLDHRHLTACPILEGEEKLRLLNLQHNSIARLQHLSSLRRLVFLDLYDNLVHDMSGLEGLLSLRVLMLGKNRIHKISGLESLMRLDVLDLHGNMIREVENLCHLSHLRVLNLAGNDITCVTGLAGLTALTELNFRRNRITHVYDIDQLPNLQRLFLSHNLIQSFTDMSCLSGSSSVTELTLDGNPLANHPDHRHSLIFHIHCLNTLDQNPILEEERDAAMAALREEEERLKEERRKTVVQEYREAAIVAIQKAWDTAHSTLHVPTALTQSSHNLNSRSTDTKRFNLSSVSLPHLLPTHMVDVTPPTLHLYGPGALEALLDVPVHERGGPLTALHLTCMEFSEVEPWLSKIHRALPDLDSVCLECTNLTTLDQINSLASLPSPLHTLTISPHGNPLTHHPLFTHYTLHRLQHLHLTLLNDKPVTRDDIAAANRVFESLAKLTTSQLHPTRHALPHHKHSAAQHSSRTPLSCDDKRVGEPQDRVVLHRFNGGDKAQHTRRVAASSFTTALHSATLEAHKKLSVLQASWTDITTTLAQQSLRECSNLDTVMAQLLDHL